MNFKSRLNLSLFFLALICLPLMLSAQGRNEEVTIVAPYKPTISDANKISLTPGIPDEDLIIPDISYSINSVPIYTKYEIEPFKPSNISVESLKDLYRNYVRLGFGNYTTPYAEFFSNSLRSKDFELGLHLKHLSSTGEIKDYANSAYSNNYAGIYGKKFMKNKILSANLFYKRNVVHYYGFKPDDYPDIDLTKEDLKQRFSKIGVEAGLNSNNKKSGKLDYQTNLSFYTLSDFYKTNETKVELSGSLSKSNEFMAFVQEQNIGINGKIIYFSNKDSLTSQGTTVIDLQPFIKVNIDYLSVYAGIDAAMSSDSSTEFHLYPIVKLAYEVIPGYLKFNAGFSGNLKRNSFNYVSNINPWVNSVFPLGFTNTKYEIAGGVSGKINLEIDYNFQVSYAEIEDMLFFVNDFEDPFSPEFDFNLGNKFTGVYDNVKMTRVNVEIGYQQSNRLRLHFSSNYYHYKKDK